MRFLAHLHNALAHGSSWMTANLFSKTEFLFNFHWVETKTIGKIHSSSFHTETQKNQQIEQKY